MKKPLATEEVQLELSAFFQTREQLAIQIATAGDSIVKITKNHYKVKSQSENRWYNVKKSQDANIWTCEVESKIEPVQRPKICGKCLSSDIVKNGLRKVKNGAKRQKYACRNCGYRFILGENGFSKVGSDPHIIVEALNLVMGGGCHSEISLGMSSPSTRRRLAMLQ